MLRENIKIALLAIKGNMLRSVLTILIIAIGITALVGILTAIDSIKQTINSSFTNLGANTFTIRNKELSVHIGQGGRKPKIYPQISYFQARQFKRKYNYQASVSISSVVGQAAVIKYKNLKTNPNVAILAVNENYLQSMGYELTAGRNISSTEADQGGHVVLISKEIVNRIFPKQKNILNEEIKIGGAKYKVIGILKEKGSGMGMGGDKTIFIPLTNGPQFAQAGDHLNYVINVTSSSPRDMEIAEEEARGTLRQVRGLKPGEEDNFEIIKSDSLSNLLIENISFVTIAATIIGLITLIGAAIGLMNIMLVSVSERTREIGVRKSLGATNKLIRMQFLIEAIVICQIGGILGIILGIATGNITSFFMDAPFIIPWLWIISGLLICLTVGLLAGIYPAVKASKLDPVEALRNE